MPVPRRFECFGSCSLRAVRDPLASSHGLAEREEACVDVAADFEGTTSNPLDRRNSAG